MTNGTISLRMFMTKYGNVGDSLVMWTLDDFRVQDWDGKVVFIQEVVPLIQRNDIIHHHDEIFPVS